MGNLLWFLALMATLAMGCEHQAITFSHDGFEPIQEDFSDIAIPRARWQAEKIKQAYSFCGKRERSAGGEHGCMRRNSRICSRRQ